MLCLILFFSSEKLRGYRYYVVKDSPKKENAPLFATVPLSSQTKAHKEQERVGETDLSTSQRLRGSNEQHDPVQQCDGLHDLD
jgi:hypothetical protein